MPAPASSSTTATTSQLTAPTAASAVVEICPMNHRSVRFRMVCTALLATSGNAKDSTARRSTWIWPAASRRCAGKLTGGSCNEVGVFMARQRGDCPKLVQTVADGPATHQHTNTMAMNAPGSPFSTEYHTVDATSPQDGAALNKDAIKHSFYSNLFNVQGKIPQLATRHDYYLALALTVRDQMLHRWISTAEAYTKHGSRTVAYFSAEFLMGPQLGNNILNLGLEQVVRQAMTELGLDYEELLECEDEPGLGNGGLGRLAACFLDSLATLEIPSIGYGIRYEFGIFQQEIVDGWQVEKTDKWLRFGNAWEIPRPEWAVEVKLGGSTET